MNVLTPKEFKAKYSASLEGVSGDAIKQAIDLVSHGDQLIPRHRAQGVVEIAQRFDAFRSTEPSIALPKIDSDALVASNEIARAFLSEVESVRREVFGTSAAPYDAWAKAVEWIEGAAAGAGDGHANPRPLMQAVLDAARRLEDEAGVRAQLQGFAKPSLPYVRPGASWVVNAPVAARYWPLVDAVESIAKRSGFNTGSVTLWILADLAPLRPRARIRVHHRWPGSPSVQMTLHTAAVTQDEIIDLLRQAQAALAESPRRRLSAKDEEFVSIVRSLGPVPGREGTKEYWEQVLAELRSRKSQPDYVGSGWRGPYNRYNRLVERGVIQEVTDE